MAQSIRLIALLVLLGCAAALRAQDAKPKTEPEKVRALIGYVEKLEGAVFIRNGTEHDCKEAAAHLRRKWDGAKDKVKTAKEFVQHAASKSSISGKPYQIRFKDGTVKTSEEVLLKKLEGIEKG
jgi:hypothetical protein